VVAVGLAGLIPAYDYIMWIDSHKLHTRFCCCELAEEAMSLAPPMPYKMFTSETFGSISNARQD
jgi:hypothetical protein